MTAAEIPYPFRQLDGSKLYVTHYDPVPNHVVLSIIATDTDTDTYQLIHELTGPGGSAWLGLCRFTSRLLSQLRSNPWRRSSTPQSMALPEALVARPGRTLDLGRRDWSSVDPTSCAMTS